MIRKLGIMFILLFLAANPGHAFDREAFQNHLEEFADGISQTAYALSESEGSAERETYNAAVERAEKHEKALKEMISSIGSEDELKDALELVETFSRADRLNMHTGAATLKHIRDRAAFLNIETKNPTGEFAVNNNEIKLADSPQVLLNRTQKRMILVDVPVVEAVISVEDNGENRRVKHLEATFGRHECKVMSQAIGEGKGEKKTNYYIAGKKFVIESLIRHYKGNTVESNLKAIMVLSSGGFWSGTTSVEVVLKADKNNPEKSTLQWYQAVLEKDPFKYALEADYGNVSQLGKIETLGGEKKFHIKNAKMKLYVTASNGNIRDAVYINNVEYGDIYVNVK